MTKFTCACGYSAENAEGLTDHLGEMFIPADDVALDGQIHAESTRNTAVAGVLTCQCGFTATGIADFDQHLLAVFTPDDAIGPDGARHAGS
jgi:hypothetical protein